MPQLPAFWKGEDCVSGNLEHTVKDFQIIFCPELCLMCPLLYKEKRRLCSLTESWIVEPFRQNSCLFFSSFFKGKFKREDKSHIFREFVTNLKHKAIENRLIIFKEYNINFLMENLSIPSRYRQVSWGQGHLSGIWLSQCKQYLFTRRYHASVFLQSALETRAGDGHIKIKVKMDFIRKLIFYN